MTPYERVTRISELTHIDRELTSEENAEYDQLIIEMD